MNTINSLSELQERYGKTVKQAQWKEIDHINDHYRQFIEASPFLILSTYGNKGIDCSPRGDPPGFVRVIDKNQLLIPDRRGNNRLDSLQNIVANGQVGLIFIVPNVGETIRVSGFAKIIVDQTLCDSFSINNKAPNSVISVKVHKAYYQCQKALVRSALWDSSTYIEREKLPTSGQMAENFSSMHNSEFDGDAYDRNYPRHIKKTIY